MNGFVVGITGGVATGKTVLARLLRRQGAAYYSVDEVAHALYRPGFPAYGAILRSFGRGVLAPDGSIDRSKLGARVFSNPAAMKKLERLSASAEGQPSILIWSTPSCIVRASSSLSSNDSTIQRGSHLTQLLWRMPRQ